MSLATDRSLANSFVTKDNCITENNYRGPKAYKHNMAADVIAWHPERQYTSCMRQWVVPGHNFQTPSHVDINDSIGKVGGRILQLHGCLSKTDYQIDHVHKSIFVHCCLRQKNILK